MFEFVIILLAMSTALLLWLVWGLTRQVKQIMAHRRTDETMISSEEGSAAIASIQIRQSNLEGNLEKLQVQLHEMREIHIPLLNQNYQTITQDISSSFAKLEQKLIDVDRSFSVKDIKTISFTSSEISELEQVSETWGALNDKDEEQKMSTVNVEVLQLRNDLTEQHDELATQVRYLEKYINQCVTEIRDINSNLGQRLDQIAEVLKSTRQQLEMQFTEGNDFKKRVDVLDASIQSVKRKMYPSRAARVREYSSNPKAFIGEGYLEVVIVNDGIDETILLKEGYPGLCSLVESEDHSAYWVFPNFTIIDSSRRADIQKLFKCNNYQHGCSFDLIYPAKSSLLDYTDASTGGKQWVLKKEDIGELDCKSTK